MLIFNYLEKPASLFKDIIFIKSRESRPLNIITQLNIETAKSNQIKISILVFQIIFNHCSNTIKILKIICKSKRLIELQKDETKIIIIHFQRDNLVRIRQTRRKH